MHTTALFVLAATGLACASVRAQCSSTWASSGGFPGTDGEVAAITTWDPDGAGPAPARLVVGGAFRFAGTQGINRVAMLDPATGAWSPLYQGVDGGVGAFATLANGELVVAGSFGGAYGTISPGLVRWNGTSWASVSGGVSLSCNAVVALPAGGLIATGLFGSAGGVPANAIAQWDGNTWSPLGSGLAGPFPVGNALVRLPNGDVIVGGDFTSAGGLPASFVARWNGSTWSAMPGLTAAVQRLALAPVSGDVIAWTGTQSSSSLHRWNGASWTPFVALGGFYPKVTTLDTLANGDLVIGGEFSGVNGTPVAHLARFDGVVWHAVGNADNPRYVTAAHVAPNGDLYIGGSFSAIASVVARSIARWDGAGWHAIGTGIGATVVLQAELLDGRQVVATSERRVLRRDGATWTALGEPLPSYIRGLEVLTNGDLVVAGDFTYYTPNPATQVLRWNGTTWVAYATPLTSVSGGGIPYVTAMHATPDGGLLVSGAFLLAGGVPAARIARWDGNAWHALPAGSNGIGLNGVAYSFATFPDGSIAVGGSFGMVGSQSRNVARWDGSNWTVYGDGVLGQYFSDGVTALAVAGNGELIAGGSFSGGSAPNYLARWNGSAWVGLGTGVDGAVKALHTLPGGDVVAGGAFTTAGGVSARLARWNGSSWSAVPGGVSQQVLIGMGPDVNSLRFLADGRLSVGGSFGSAGGVFSPFLAVLASGCPASTASYGAGCTGTGGALVLSRRELAWLGGTMRNDVSGLVPTSLVARALGFAPAALPLASVHPAGGPGCDLLVDPVVVDFVLPLHGTTVTTALAIPAATSLIGATVREQAIEIEVDAGFAFTRINASNALFATLGAF